MWYIVKKFNKHPCGAMNWLLDSTPDWLLLLLAAGAVVAVLRFVGVRGAVMSIAPLLLTAAYRKGRASARAEIENKLSADLDRATKIKKEIEDETRSLSDRDLDARNSRWVRRR